MSNKENFNMVVEIPKFLTEKDGLLYVRTHDEHYLHQSFLLPDGQVLIFESIPVNYPSNALAFFDNLDEYVKAIRKVDWINDEEYIIRNELDAYGFTFPSNDLLIED